MAWEYLSAAISGTPAIVGVPNDDGNDGNDGQSSSVYFVDAAGSGKCPWELDANGSVVASDLLTLLVSWGPCKGCPSDFVGHGNVSTSDLLTMLVNLGSCP